MNGKYQASPSKAKNRVASHLDINKHTMHHTNRASLSALIKQFSMIGLEHNPTLRCNSSTTNVTNTAANGGFHRECITSEFVRNLMSEKKSMIETHLIHLELQHQLESAESSSSCSLDIKSHLRFLIWNNSLGRIATLILE